MLWYKSWLETRWRFLIGLALMILSTCVSILIYPQMSSLLQTSPPPNLGGELGRRVAEAIELSREFRGYVWSQLFGNNLATQAAIFGVLIGTGGLLSQAARGSGGMFTLSLPVSRNRLTGIRAATGLAELLALAVIPSLLVPLLSPAVGESYRFGDAVVHALCLFIGATAFFSLAFLLSTVFSDLWRPLLLVLGLALVLSFVEQINRDFSRYSVFGVMSGQAFFRGGAMPWIGLVVTATASVVMLRAAASNLARRDF